MWNGKTFNVKCDPTLPVDAFLQKLQNLTGVPVLKQTLMMRRKQLKSGMSFPAGEVKEGYKFMLIGTAQIAPVWKDFKEEIVEEAPDEADEAATPADAMVGCKNYGNTCYLNSCLQTLRNIPDISKVIKEYKPDGKGDDLITAIAKFFNNPEQEYNLPTVVKSLRIAHPDPYEAKDDQTGGYMQQDATECMATLFKHFSTAFGPKFTDLFNMRLKTIVSDPTGEKPPKVTYSEDNSIDCHIDENVSSIEMGMFKPSDIESTEGGKIAVYHQVQQLDSLPKFFTVHLLRFTYREDEKTTAKILRRVNHPFRLDILSFASDELRAQIAKARESDQTKGSGFYQLKAVLTHQGRSANSGHYITHVKVNDEWIRYNDEKVSVVTEEDIENLKGSGDWHCSFLLIYQQIE